MRHSDQLRKFSNNHSLLSTAYYLIFFLIFVLLILHLDFPPLCQVFSDFQLISPSDFVIWLHPDLGLGCELAA